MNKIFLYVPNIVGYVRLLLLLASTQYEGYNFVALFIISATLDFVDGYTARLFDQATLFGSCFDMMIDRLSTVVIMYRIIAAEPKYTVILTQLFMIDFISHFLHFNVSLITKKHHKDMTSRLLRFYYNKSVLFAICSLEQICFCLLYLFGFCFAVFI